MKMLYVKYKDKAKHKQTQDCVCLQATGYLSIEMANGWQQICLSILTIILSNICHSDI